MSYSGNMFDVVIDIQGKEHSGKTSAMAVIAAHLRNIGVDVVLQEVEQLHEKLDNPEKAEERIQRCRVLIRETHTGV